MKTTMNTKHPLNLIVQVDAQTPQDMSIALMQLAYDFQQGTYEIADRQEGMNFDLVYQLKEK